MKKNIRFIFSPIFIFLLLTSFRNSEKDFLSANSGELIVTFENLSMKELSDLDQAILQLEGITMTSYCQKINCYCFNYDENKYVSLDSAFEELALKTKRFMPLIKIGTTKEMVDKYCQNLN